MTAGDELAANRDGAVLAEDTVLPEAAADGEHLALERQRRPAGRAMHADGPVAPVEAIEAPPPSAVDPALHRPQRYAEPPRDGPLRPAAAHCGHHRAAQLLAPARDFLCILPPGADSLKASNY